MALRRQTANPSGDLLTAGYICPPPAAKHDNPPSYSWGAAIVIPHSLSHTDCKSGNIYDRRMFPHMKNSLAHKQPSEQKMVKSVREKTGNLKKKKNK